MIERRVERHAGIWTSTQPGDEGATSKNDSMKSLIDFLFLSGLVRRKDGVGQTGGTLHAQGHQEGI